MKQLKRQLVLMALAAFVSLTASGYDFTVDSIYYDVVSLSDLTCQVTFGDTEYTGNVTIPSTVNYNGRTVTVVSIGDKAFACCHGLTSVEIPNSVTSIGEDAFYWCVSLVSAKIGNSVTSIGEEAFYYCWSLTSVKIPNSVTSIGEEAFFGCTNLKSVDIPNSVCYIGEYAFSETGIETVVIPDSIRSLKYTFSYCHNLKSVVIPDGIESLNGTFAHCDSLQSIITPNGVSYFSGGALIIPNSVSYMAWAFDDCDNLTSVVIPNSVKTLKDFSNCTNLKSVAIGNNVSSMGNPKTGCCFEGTYNITQLQIGNRYTMWWWLSYGTPSRITTLAIAEDYSGEEIPTYATYQAYRKNYGEWIENGAGYGYITDFKNLKTIISKTLTPLSLDDNFSTSQYVNIEVIVPTASLAQYQAADVWKKFWNLKGGAENYDAPTGITITTENKKNVKNVVYDISGRKLKIPQRGLNIINGRKVLVK